MNHRIKEQFGNFFIEKEVETKIKKTNLLSKLLPFIFKPKIKIEKAWFEIGYRGAVSNFISPSLRFNNFKEANKAIYNLSPKFHNYDEYCNCNFENRILEKTTLLVCKCCDKKL
jgi:hypothetical protein